MDIEQDYVEYVAEFSLALLAASSAYFLEPSRPVTYLTLLLIPVLFGYTAYISRESFSTSTFLGFIALIFVPLGTKLAAVSLFIAVGNVLVSLFAGGERFRDYYSATTLPLLLTGAALGTGLFLVASSNPQVAEDIRTTAGNALGENVENAVEDAELLQRQAEAQRTIVRQTSRATIRATEAYVLNRTADDYLNQQPMIDAFDSAEQDIPQTLANRTGSSINTSAVDISGTTSRLVSSNLRGQVLLVLIPLITLLLYSLQPVVGFLTAVSATLFSMAMTAGED